MPSKIDYHIHSRNSSDGSASLDEIAARLKAAGVTEAAITDHIPELPGHVWYGDVGAVVALKKARDRIEDQYGFRLFVGAEIDVIDNSGRLAAPEALVREFEIVISGVHRCPTLMRPLPNKESMHYGPAEYYAISEGVLRNPLVTLLAHPVWAFDRLFMPEHKDQAVSMFPEIYKREIMRVAAHEGKPVEINDAEIHLMDDAWFAFGKTYGTTYSIGSDGHKLENIGNVDRAYAAVARYNIPASKILDLERTSTYRKSRSCAGKPLSKKRRTS
jgi:histidinol phosphatase-like PHP family hydrolase